MATLTEERPVTTAKDRLDFVPIKSISIIYNPRKYFDKSAMDELAEDIKNRGVIQPILIRPGPEAGQYFLVSGERRLRASQIGLGPDGVIPAYIRHMTEEDAIAAAAAENEVRQDTSETEQADAAVALMALCNGNKAEASKRLGWSQTKFERRLALSNLTAEIKDALNERRILLGHAELLATVPQDKQNLALKKIIDDKITVAQTQTMLDRMSRQLSAAIFDKTECASCKFNSTLQRSLFSTTVFDGACTNKTCYDLKTEQEESKRQKKAEQEQAEQEKLSESENNNTNAGSETEPETPPEEDEGNINETTPDVNDSAKSPGSGTTTPETKATAAAKTTQKENAPDDKTIRTQMIAKTISLRETIWRRALAKHLSADKLHAEQILVFAGYTGTIRQITKEKLSARSEILIGENFKENGSIKTKFEIISKLDEEKLSTAKSSIASAFAMDCTDFQIVSEACKLYNLDIRELWTVSKDFLELFTKNELKLLAMETGFLETYGAKPFSKLLGGKRAEAVETMAGYQSFSWSGRLPSCMTLSGVYEGPTT